jgi:hypothetical protein
MTGQGVGLLAGVALFVTVTAPAVAQSLSLQQMLAGKEIPHTLKLRELNGEWQRLSLSTVGGAKAGAGDTMSQLMQAGMMSEMGKNKGKGKDDAMGAMLGMSLLGGLFGGGGESKDPVYYTRGQTVAVGSETFLVAYRYQKPETNLMQMALEADKGGKDPDFAKMAASGKLSPDSTLKLSLINLRAINSLEEIRAFDMDQEIAASAQGGGLMELFAQEAMKEAQEPKPVPKPAAKPGAAPAAKPKAKRR